MPKVTFILRNGEKREIEAENGQTLMEIGVKNNIETIEGACGGCLACGTCHVHIHPDWWDKCLPDDGEISDDEEDMMDLGFHVEDGTSRLSCQIVINENLDGLVVGIPGGKQKW